MTGSPVSKFQTNFKSFRNDSIRGFLNFPDILGQPVLKRSLEICAAGRHHILLFGPPGSWKNQALRELSRIETPNIKKTRFHHVIISNPCPCGNLGIEKKICTCSVYDLRRYWRKIGGVYLDTFDMRVPVQPIDPAYLFSGEGESCESIKRRVEAAVKMQEERFSEELFSRNGGIPAGAVKQYCKLDEEIRILFTETVRKLSLSSKACHSVLKISRTIADLNQCLNIERDHFLEAVYYRRYGDRDIFWNEM